MQVFASSALVLLLLSACTGQPSDDAGNLSCTLATIPQDGAHVEKPVAFRGMYTPASVSFDTNEGLYQARCNDDGDFSTHAVIPTTSTYTDSLGPEASILCSDSDIHLVGVVPTYLRFVAVFDDENGYFWQGQTEIEVTEPNGEGCGTSRSVRVSAIPVENMVPGGG